MVDIKVFSKNKIVVKKNKPLASKTWLGVGGCAEFYTEPNTIESLKRTLVCADAEKIPVTILGSGSNLLIRDGGIEGLVIHFGSGLKKIHVEKNKITCGAGARLMDIARAAAQHNLSGFEFMEGIPGSLGGGFKTNAGAYGSDLSKITREIIAMDEHGIKHVIHPQKEDVFGYRTCKLPPAWVFVQAVLVGTEQPTNEAILAKMAEYQQKRHMAQPQGVKTAGSTFKNPPDHRAWELLDAAGLRGYTKNGAQFSTKHPNFLINLGSARAHDLEVLICEAQGRVLAQTGIQLECEVHILGKEKK